MSGARPPLLALALDAVDAPLALGWAREGRLPVLGGLLDNGALVRLRTLGHLFPESLWPTIISGDSLARHGLYNWRVVPAGEYTLRSVHTATARPIWRLLREHDPGARAVLVDIPYTEPGGDNGVVELIGWGQRGATLDASWPPELLDDVRRRHGRYPPGAHTHFHRRSLAQRHVLRTLERWAEVRTRLVAELLREAPWSFCMACYSEPHNAGHEFHRYLEPGTWGHERRRARGAEDGLLRVYQAVDRGVGRLIAAAGERVNVVAFSGMGMRSCSSGDRLLKRVLVGLGYEVPAAGQPTRLRPLATLQSRVPWSLRRLLHLRLSQEAREDLQERLWLGATDWSRSRAFGEREPGIGLVHINVRGRDPQGIVEPGAPYRALCEEIARELGELREVESGEPAVTEVLHRDELVEGADGEELPDLIVRFAQERLLAAVRHTRLGVVRENVRDVPYSEHTGEGFAVAAGPGIRSGVSLEAELEPLAPTLLALMGVPVPETMPSGPLSAMLR